MRVLAHVSIAASFVVVTGVVFSACEEDTRACKNVTDCPSGQSCNRDNVCVDSAEGGEDPGEGEVILGPGGEGEEGNEGEGDRRQQIFAQAPTTMLIDDPRDPTKALFTEYQPGGGGLDRVIQLDKATFVPVETPVFNMQNAQPPGPCNIDTFQLQAGIAPPNKVDEFWFSCAAEQGKTRIYYDAFDAQNLGQRGGVPPAGSSNQLFVAVQSNEAQDDLDFLRFVFTKRGGTTLSAVRINEQDALEEARDAEAITGVTFSAITQLFFVAEGDPTLGDFILVFDRGGDGDPPRLVPLQRALQDDKWQPAPAPFLPRRLPNGTEAVVLFGDAIEPDFNGVADINQPNVMVIVPTTGTQYFYNYQKDEFFVDGNGNATPSLPPTLYETNGIFQKGQDPEDRVLAIDDGRGHLFYTTYNTERTWRLSFVPGDQNAALTFTDDSSFLPNGLVVADDTHVILTHQGKTEIVKGLLKVGN
jgi:hypothetical protein